MLHQCESGICTCVRTSWVWQYPCCKACPLIGIIASRIKVAPTTASPACSLRRGRLFVLSYFMGDASLSIFEPPQRNSGLPGGKFLERMQVRRSWCSPPQHRTSTFPSSTLSKLALNRVCQPVCRTWLQHKCDTDDRGGVPYQPSRHPLNRASVTATTLSRESNPDGC